MNRRHLIMLLSGAMIAKLPSARAQKAMPFVGFLHSAAPGQISDLIEAFRAGLKESGFTEGQNVAIEYRLAENAVERLPALAADLVTTRSRNRSCRR
jgi:putative ABC transport system substrate-binding protein